jgi:hypothetical protein
VRERLSLAACCADQHAPEVGLLRGSCCGVLCVPVFSSEQRVLQVQVKTL